MKVIELVAPRIDALQHSACAAPICGCLHSTGFIIGFLSGTEGSIDVGPAMERRIRVQGNNTGPVADLADAAAAMTALGIKTVLDATFPMDQAQDAYKHVAAGGDFGKVLSVSRSFDSTPASPLGSS